MQRLRTAWFTVVNWWNQLHARSSVTLLRCFTTQISLSSVCSSLRGQNSTFRGLSAAGVQCAGTTHVIRLTASFLRVCL